MALMKQTRRELTPWIFEWHNCMHMLPIVCRDQIGAVIIKVDVDSRFNTTIDSFETIHSSLDFWIVERRKQIFDI